MNARPRPGLARAGAALPWLAAALAMGGYFLLFTPGHYSFDAAYQWWMARHGEFHSTHPVAMTWLWRGSAALLPDPQGFFALQLAFVGAGLALVASALPWSRGVQALVVLGFAAWPAIGGLLPQVWKDVWLLGALLLACGALLHGERRPHIGWRALALLMLAFATALRFNALTGVLPLLAWLLVQQRRAAEAAAGGPVPARRWLWPLPLVLLLAGLPGALTPQRVVPAWPYVALWDLVAVGLETGRLDIPPSLLAEGATPAAFAPHFRADSNTSTLASGLTRYSEARLLEPGEASALLRAWLCLPLREPAAWARHRLRLAGHLLGGSASPRDPRLMLMPGIVPLRDNPLIAPNSSPWAGRLQAFWERSTATPVFEGRWYLLLALAVAGLAVWRRQGPALAIAASALALALPLLLVAPSAEFRFLLWTVAAALLSALLLAAGRYPSRR
ncbi:MAG: hypothetical protein KatS3mg127_0473 [Silanimonas sp.]|nr:MAG: hypothetical protein KatS3mg127_0473 [Silanimonas sp.]